MRSFRQPLSMLLIGALALGSVLTAAAGEDLQRVPGKPRAADFELQGPDGTVHRLADYLGRPLVLNFWATWCPPCRAEMPSLQRAYEQLAPEGIGVVAINVGEDAETVDRLLATLPLDLPLPLDEDASVMQRYPLDGLPTTFIIDADGRLVLEAAGERVWDDPRILEKIRALK